MLKYAAFAFLGGLIGAFVSMQLGYNDGSLQIYLISALAASIGGSITGLIREKKVNSAKNKEAKQ